MADDLKDVDIADEVKAEILSTSWEFARCVIPHYTNWNRYIAYTRCLVLSTTAEFNGDIVDVLAGDNILGYSLSGILAALFEGTVYHEYSARELRANLLVSGDKSSNRRDGELFRRYVNALANSPRDWFRMRDCDGLIRFTFAAALACNDLVDRWFSETQLEILSEMTLTMYDAVAFYKHRAEGEVHNTFAYMPEDMRVKAFRQSREVLWALDAASASQTKFFSAINVARFIVVLHIPMRRYRFVQEDLTIGRPETDSVVAQTRDHVKLWNRIDAKAAKEVSAESIQRYHDVVTRRELMFPGLAELLQTVGDGNCDTCRYRLSYGAETMQRFGGVELCDGCRVKWRSFLESFPERAAEAFPELVDMYNSGITSTRNE
ncbi:hypothetical protein B0H11DRAFT_1748474 [Mycena galericulata]|nr:hypothetical protein B0H11DRAFT_1748474 [Mycena galericulata]